MNWFERFSSRGRAPERDKSTVAERMAAAHDAAIEGDYEAALEIWGPLAHSGVARAQNNIGACFAEGLGIARNEALAVHWLKLAAEASDRVGQRNRASPYFKVERVRPDYLRAAALYVQAARGCGGPAH